jgi:hypothetical protein
MYKLEDDISFLAKQVDELMGTIRNTLLSNVLSGISLFGLFMTLDDLLMAVSICSALLSSIVSMTSLYRFFVFLRDRSRGVSSQNQLTN